MRLSGSFYLSEMALSIYLILTGVLLAFHHEIVPHAMGLIVLRVVVVSLIMVLALAQPSEKYRRVLDLLRLLLPLAMLAYLYGETDKLNNFLFKEDLDPFFSGIEASIFKFQPSRAFALELPGNWFAEAMYFGYFSYYLLLLIIPLYIYFKTGREEAHRVMFIILHSFFIFYLVFIILPVGGPQFYFTDWPPLPGGYVFGHVMRLIQKFGEAPTGAFPSSHVSICIMLVVISARHARPLLKVILPVGILLIMSTVYIRAHYVIDVVAAGLVTWPLYAFSSTIYERFHHTFNS